MVGIREDDRMPKNLVRDIILTPVQINPISRNRVKGASIYG